MNTSSSSSMTLTSLVLLKHQIDGGKDYYDYLVPFVEQIYIEEPEDAFTASEIKGIMESDFGLVIPQDVISYILKRMRKRGNLKEVEHKFCIGEKFKGRDLKPEKDKATKEIDEVLTALQKYSKTLGIDELSHDHAMEAIQRFLSKFQIDCIATYVQKTALPSLSSINHLDEGLVGLFIQDAVENNYELFEKFMVLVQGNMLANALISTDTQTPPDTFRKTTFYFDTPNLLRALGYSGEELKRPVDELVKLLKRLNGHIATFEHCVEEATRIVNSAANNIENLDYAQKPLNLVARQSKWTRSDLLTKADRLASDIQDLGFKIKTTPSYNQRFQIDEQKLKELLIEANVNTSETQSEALKFDVTSIRSIYCLRGDSLPNRLEEANAIFVTSNSGFAHASCEYAKVHDSHPRIGAAINNFSLTNLAWLKAPDFASNLINEQTITLAYSALKLSQGELDAFLTKAQEIVKEGKASHDDLTLLRLTPILQNELAIAKVLGKDLQVEETISSVIGKVRAEYSAEADQNKAALHKEREEHRQTQRKLQEYHKKENEEKARKSRICRVFSYLLSGIIFSLFFIVTLLWIAHEFGVDLGKLAFLGSTAALLVVAYFAASIFGYATPVKFKPIYHWFLKHCQKIYSKDI